MADVGRKMDVEDALVVDRRDMPYQMDEGLGERARIGLIVLATDQTVEHEFRQIVNVPGVTFYESRIPFVTTVTPETLTAMERDISRVADVIMTGLRLDVVAYGCTSGGMIIGDEKVHARIHEVRPEISCTTPMESTVAAVKALEARRVCLVTPYSDEINRLMRAYILDKGLTVPVMGSWNEPDDTKVARITPASIREAVLDLGRDDTTDVVFLSCTSLRAAHIITELEGELGKPVISSNQTLAWHCLRLAGVNDKLPQFGKLFNRTLV